MKDIVGVGIKIRLQSATQLNQVGILLDFCTYYGEIHTIEIDWDGVKFKNGVSTG